MSHLNIKLSGADLHGLSIEETLHSMDCTTPPTIIYEDLIPRDINASLSTWEIYLKDFEYPLLVVPPESNWETSGLIIIADPAPLQECLRSVNLPLDFQNGAIRFVKNVNPVKVYARTSTLIRNAAPVQMCLGVCIEPVLADIIQVIDSFTKPSADSSPPIGWWDKLRHVFHGSNQVKIIGPGPIVFRILGSTSPYFDPRKHFGSSGVEVHLKEDVEFQIGGDTEATEVVINCGEFKISLPEAQSKLKSNWDGDKSSISSQSTKSQGYKSSEMCIGKMKGSIRINVVVDFLTANPKREKRKEIPPWRQHHNIVLRAAESNSKGPAIDSYVGFRTSNMHLRIDIKSPTNNALQDKQLINTIFLNSTTLKNIQILEGIYQSVLTSMPIKRGKVFNVDYKSIDKPKLGNTVRRIQLTILLQPLVLSTLSELEDLSGGVGVRHRAEQLLLDLVYAQHYSSVNAGVENGGKKRKPVTKWNMESTQVSLSGNESRILKFSSKGSSSSEEEHHMELNKWVFPEDLKFVDRYRDLEMIPFLW
jgi:RNA pol II promoter Fmp27 protein domain